MFISLQTQICLITDKCEALPDHYMRSLRSLGSGVFQSILFWSPPV